MTRIELTQWEIGKVGPIKLKLKWGQ